MNTQIKVGVDPSLLGFCVSIINKSKVIDFLFIHVEPFNNVMLRILTISTIFEEFIKRNKVKSANIETPYFNRLNPKTYSQQMRLYQQILYVLESNDVLYREYMPTQIKKTIGSGKLTKKEMRVLMLKKYKFLNKIDLDKFTELELEGLMDSIAIGLI